MLAHLTGRQHNNPMFSVNHALPMLIGGLPRIIAYALTSLAHPVSANEVEVQFFVSHKFSIMPDHFTLDIFASPDQLRLEQAEERKDLILTQIKERGLLYQGVSLYAEIHWEDSIGGRTTG